MALQLGHRMSEDLDWFTFDPLPKNLKKDLRALFKDSPFEPEVEKKDELTVPLFGVKTTFFRYPFKLVYPVLKPQGFALADIREIALMKAFAIGQRATLRDYVDLYFIFKSGVDINSLAKMLKLKYGDEFDFRMFLEQLVYLKDTDRQKIKFLQGEVNAKKMLNYFEQLVKTVKL